MLHFDLISRSLNKRKITFAVNIISVILAGALFVLHNTICLPYGKLQGHQNLSAVYALYGLAEYIAVGTNIYFNYQMALMVGDGKRIFLSFNQDPKAQ